MDHQGHKMEFAYRAEQGNAVYFCNNCAKLIPIEKGESEKFGDFTESKKDNHL